MSDDEHFWGPGCLDDDEVDATGVDNVSETIDVDQYLFQTKADALRPWTFQRCPFRICVKSWGVKRLLMPSCELPRHKSVRH